MIKDLGTERLSDGKMYSMAIFECPVCLSEVKKIKRLGINSKYCSHSCYAISRGLRGAYKSGEVKISGYLYTYKPDHPNCTKKGYVATHRLVAEKKIGRYLTEDEVAHHKNEIKTDNRSRNIQVMTASEHIKYHKSKNKRNKYGQFTI